MNDGIVRLLAQALPDLEVRAAEPVDGAWLAATGEAPGFRLRTVAGASCLWHADRVADIAADLDGAEPLLNRVETVSGWRFEPSELLRQRPAAVIAIRQAQTVLEVALEPIAHPSSTLLTAAAAAPRPATLPFPRQLRVTGPVVPVDQLATLAPGDLVLLPDTLPATIAGLDQLPCTLALEGGRLLSSRWERPSSQLFGAPLEIALPPVLLSDDDLARLAATEIAVGPVADGAAVELLVGGQPIGTGLLVRLGQAHAIQVTALAGQEANAG